MTLFFYVLKDYFKYVLGTLSLTVFLFMMFDFIHKTTGYIPKYQPSFFLIAKLYFFQIPSLLVQSIPIASLLASVITMVLLSRTNEVTAMRAVGMGPLRVGMPVALGGGLLSFIAAFFGEVVLPVSTKSLHYIQEVQIEKMSTSEVNQDVKWLRNGSVIYNFDSYDSINRSLKGVSIVYAGDDFSPSKIVKIDSANFVEDSWLGASIDSYDYQDGVLKALYSNKSEVVDLPFAPDKLLVDRRLPNELSLVDLSNKIHLGRVSGVDVLSLEVDFYYKLAFYFASLVVSLIGLRFGYSSERSTETAKGVLLAVAIGISYWFILSATLALGKRGSISPFLAGWTPNFVILFAAIHSINKSRKSN